ncbi:MAG: FAD-binding protein [Lachnospiraceae bacterium]|nr:FAD-binding protein [Lachnospiraceae bacterium]
MAYQIERLKTDVVVIGGGLAGSLASIRVKEDGADVIVLEKANTNRSGNAGSGLDHMFSYVPPVHEKVGYTKDFMKSDMYQIALMGLGLGNKKIVDHFVDVSYERVISLEKYGVNFRFEDSHLAEGFRLVPQFHSVPTSFHFEGRDLMVKLTEGMKKAGVNIVNHAQVVKIIKNKEGKASGAIAVSDREEKIYVVEAKTVILTTAGGAARVGDKMNFENPYFEHPSSTDSGWGHTLAMNAGADVINMEFMIKNGGLAFPQFTFTAGAPGGTWWPAARVVDDEGNVIVERVTDYSIDEPDYLKKNVEMLDKFAIQKVTIGKLLNEGKQLYVDLKEATDEEVEYIKWSMHNEGKCWLYLRNLEYNNIDLRDVKIPYRLFRHVTIGAGAAGVLVNERTETTVENLYVAGDLMGGAGTVGAPTAVVYGIEAGLQAAKKAKETTYSNDEFFVESQINEVKVTVEKLRGNKGGEKWQSVLERVHSIVETFGIYPLTDGKINSALELIRKLKEEVNIYAPDDHELSRAFEVLSIIQTAEAIFTAADLRKENLGPFKRYKDNDTRIYGERVPAENAVLPEATEYGLYIGEDGTIHHHIHKTNQDGGEIPYKEQTLNAPYIRWE